MKTMNQVLAAAAVAAVLGISSTVRAQALAVGDDGIASSPKVRAQMNERKAVTAVPSAAKTVVVVTETGAKPAPVAIAASPKVAQMLAEREATKKVVVGNTNIASTTGAAKDGIAASPRVRTQMNERGETFEIAPVK